MCGILGGISVKRLDDQVLRAALNSLIHRGPDDWGLHQDDDTFLGVRRLAIIDTTGGHQPIYNEDRSVVVVLNGEIYNYVELLKDLKAHGHTFRTSTDT